MNRWLLIAVFAVVLGGGWAFAEEGEHHEGAGAEEHLDNKAETPKLIFEHVSDSEVFELEAPWGAHLEVPIAHWFQFLLIERTPGACSAPVAAAWSAFPSLGSFIGGCWDLRPTKAIFSMWIALCVMGLFLFLGRKRDAHGVPKGLFSHLVEVLALFVRDEIVIPNIGKKDGPRYVPYLTSLFFVVTFTDWLGLIPGFFTGTGVITVTAALAILTFLLTQAAAIRSAGLLGYLSHLTGGVPPFLWIIMIPVEILGLFTKPFALLVRLFANMLGGHMVVLFLLGLIFLWTPWAAPLSLLLAVPILVLEIFVGILQAYLFTLLTSLFIGQGVAMGHHGHEEAHGHEESHAH